jgi:hypothetical protein
MPHGIQNCTRIRIKLPSAAEKLISMSPLQPPHFSQTDWDFGDPFPWL